MMNYKEEDRKAIMSYISNKGGTASVVDIINESGADKLRVYTIIFEQVDAKKLIITESGDFGGPIEVRLCD